MLRTILQEEAARVQIRAARQQSIAAAIAARLESEAPTEPELESGSDGDLVERRAFLERRWSYWRRMRRQVRTQIKEEELKGGRIWEESVRVRVLN
jgi:hypothetical protein